MSSLPFGFWSVWDAEVIMRAFDSRAKVFIAFRLLVCLGHEKNERQQRARKSVFIAFRLLVCLGLRGLRGSYNAGIVFIAFRLLVCLGPAYAEVIMRGFDSRLHCLSAFGLFGTASADTTCVE